MIGLGVSVWKRLSVILGLGSKSGTNSGFANGFSRGFG